MLRILLFFACASRPLAVPDLKLTIFQEWLKAGGAEIDGLKVGETPSGRRGVVATRPIKKGEDLLRLPSKLFFSSKSLSATGTCVDTLADQCGVDGDLGGLAKLSLALLVERGLGRASNFSAWFAVLPETFDTPLWWPEEDLNLLQGSKLYQIILGQKLERDSLYQKFSDVCPEFAKTYSREDWYWADSLARTRGGVQGTNVKRIYIPLFVDMINHNDPVNLHHKYDNRIDGSSFVAKAGEDLEMGQEVFINYGIKDSDTWLKTHGFVPEDILKQRVNVTRVSLPMCIPPLVAFPERKELRSSIFNVSDMPYCCHLGVDDKTCFLNDYVKAPSLNVSLMMMLGQPETLSGNMDTNTSNFARILSHFRMLALSEEEEAKCVLENIRESLAPARSLADWVIGCREGNCKKQENWAYACTKQGHCNHLHPISPANELEALQLFKALIEAHLEAMFWVDASDNTVDPFDDPHLTQEDLILKKAKADKEAAEMPKVERTRREVIHDFMKGHKKILEWHLKLVDFVTPLLKLEDFDALQLTLCDPGDDVKTAPRMWRDHVLRLVGYMGYVDSAVAPLLYAPWREEVPCLTQGNIEVTDMCFENLEQAKAWAESATKVPERKISKPIEVNFGGMR